MTTIACFLTQLSVHQQPSKQTAQFCGSTPVGYQKNTKRVQKKNLRGEELVIVNSTKSASKPLSRNKQVLPHRLLQTSTCAEPGEAARRLPSPHAKDPEPQPVLQADCLRNAQKEQAHFIQFLAHTYVHVCPKLVQRGCAGMCMQPCIQVHDEIQRNGLKLQLIVNVTVGCLSKASAVLIVILKAKWSNSAPS